MTYAIVDIVWAKSHGIEILPEMRTSVDQSKVILHEEMLLPFSDEDFPRYSFSDPEFINLLSSDEWTYPEGEESVINRDFSRILALNILDEEVAKNINTYELTPAEALQVKDCYPEWIAGITVKVGERYLSDDILWECIQGHTTQENWKPSMATASLWKTVDEDHKGTIDDPILYTPPMEIFKDKYYIQNGVIYKCTRDSEQPLTHDLSALVGLYVETV
nr:MAG TPA_asm: ChiA1-BD-binding domain protein [Caudoviricetes sp.]